MQKFLYYQWPKCVLRGLVSDDTRLYGVVELI